MVKLPDRWTAYSNCGRRINGSRLVSFKTPLKDNYFYRQDAGHRWGVNELIQTIPNLGLVIDLTYSTKYYYPDELFSRGIHYEKILCEGHVIPAPNIVKKFIDTIDAFLDANRSNDKLVGVHCTHGLNRTGYLVCRYLIERLRYDPEIAIRAFENARGHKMERPNYIEHIKNSQRHIIYSDFYDY